MKYFLILTFLTLGCVSPCAPGYYKMYSLNENIIPEKDPIVLQKFLLGLEDNEITKKPKLVGDYGNEWKATLKSTNGIVTSVREENPDFAYTTDLGKPLQLTMILDNWSASDTFFAPSYPNTREVEVAFIDPTWTRIEANQVQSIMDNSVDSQSYKYFPHPEPTGGMNIKKVGIRAIIQKEDGRIRTLKIEKVIYE